MNTTTSKFNISTNDIIALIIFFCYYIVDFFPLSVTYSMNEGQWLYLSCINVIGIGYCIYDHSLVESFNLKKILQTKLILGYISFLLLCSLSILAAYNIFEGILSLSRYLITFLAFINLYLIFKNRIHLFAYMAAIISVILFIESFIRIRHIISGYSSDDFSTLIINTIHNRGNKNTFSSMILVKIPIAVYCIYYFKSWLQRFFIAVFALSTCLLFILSTRALIIGLFMMTVLYAIINIKYKIINSKTNIVLGIVLALSFGIGTLVVKNGKTTISNNVFERNLQINTGDESLNIRLNLWHSTLPILKEKPILGCGLGNFKIESSKYDQLWKSNYTTAIHMHNDFLEVFAETGILNGVVLLFLFLLIAFINIKKIISAHNNQIRFIHSIILICFVGYSIDSFFNFPMAIATSQIIFTFIAFTSLFASGNIEALENNTPNSKKIALFLLLLLSITTVFPNYIQNNFYKNLGIIAGDEDLKMNANQVISMLPAYPNLDIKVNPTECIKAEYLIKEKRYDEAKQILNKVTKVNPYTIYHYNLYLKMFAQESKTDSILKYNKLMLERMPLNNEFYKEYIQNLSFSKDTTAILKEYEKIMSLKKSGVHYATTAKYLSMVGYNPEKCKEILNEGLTYFPNDSILKKELQLISTPQKATTIDTNQPKASGINYNLMLQEMLATYIKIPNDIGVNENIGICYYELKKYKEALPYSLKAIELNKNSTGKSEYIVALCYHFLNDKANSCKYAQIAASKGFMVKESKDIIKVNCE